jgi:hypothetical protein
MNKIYERYLTDEDFRAEVAAAARRARADAVRRYLIEPLRSLARTAAQPPKHELRATRMLHRHA